MTHPLRWLVFTWVLLSAVLLFLGWLLALAGVLASTGVWKVLGVIGWVSLFVLHPALRSARLRDLPLARVVPVLAAFGVTAALLLLSIWFAPGPWRWIGLAGLVAYGLNWPVTLVSRRYYAAYQSTQNPA